MIKLTSYLFLVLTVFSVFAEAPTDTSGDVRVPLDDYIQMIEQLRNPKQSAPASYAIGQSEVTVKINDIKDRTTAIVTVKTSIETFEDQWTLIPILPYGAAITSVHINGVGVQLVQNAEWLSWSTNKAAVSSLELNYSIDASRSDTGYVIPLPIPRAASTKLSIEFPVSELDMAVVPSSNLSYQKLGEITRATASIPTTSSLLISWRIPSQKNHVISRAHYQGKLTDGAVTFTANYQVELFTGESVNLPLISSSVTLNDVKIDNKSATILEQEGQFVVVLQGRGRHDITVVFQAPVKQQQGPPTVSFPIPRVPISQFDLQLSGKKEVSVLPKTNVVNRITKDMTTATVYLPMTDEVSFSWVDAVPKDVRAKLRANANIYHAIWAEEGVLYAQGLIDYEVTHGETTTFSFDIPKEAQVNRISSPAGGISDWAVKTSESGKTITVFLDRAIKANYQLQVFYEQLLTDNNESQQAISIPLIRAKQMHRQRGFVALLAGSELALKPIEETAVSRVGENQLPAFFKNQITQTIAHTFKYTSDAAQLTVNTIAPERKQGKYDALVDTLVSLGEVSMRGSASIQLDVKSGAIVDLQLQLPKDINVLNVTGPSLRNHSIVTQHNNQNINIEFTQEMTGQFNLEVNYEKILRDSKSELVVPSLQVLGAEVQHGRIAVEALTAVEVQTSQSKQLSPLEINELPQQLVLKTTNPILLAFKYVNTESPQLLKLRMTRHQELDVQVAAIETAHYQTLVTDDGLAVTTAKFTVRNSRRQFLRLNLPKGSQVWSVFVDGKAEKPANANRQNKAGSNEILIKMLNSVSGFPVEVIYATAINKMGLFGSINSYLPLPDMVVTRSFWDVFLPIGPNYQSVETNMNVISAGRVVNPQQHTSNAINRKAINSTQAGSPLRMTVPQQGIQYSFEKLYANQSDSVAGFQIRYASASGNQLGIILSIISVILIWAGIFALRSMRVSQRVVIAVLVAGILGLFLSLSFFRTATTAPFATALAGGVLFLSTVLAPKIQNWRASKK